MQGDPIDGFVDKLIDEKKLPGLDDETRIQIAADLKELLMANINKALIYAVPEDKTEELYALLDETPIDQEKIQQYIEQQVDAKQIMTEELLRFRDLYLDNEQLRGEAEEVE